MVDCTTFEIKDYVGRTIGVFGVMGDVDVDRLQLDKVGSRGLDVLDVTDEDPYFACTKRIRLHRVSSYYSTPEVMHHK